MPPHLSHDPPTTQAAHYRQPLACSATIGPDAVEPARAARAGAGRPLRASGSDRCCLAAADAAAGGGGWGAPARVKWGRLPWGLGPPDGGSLEKMANM